MTERKKQFDPQNSRLTISLRNSWVDRTVRSIRHAMPKNVQAYWYVVCPGIKVGLGHPHEGLKPSRTISLEPFFRADDEAGAAKKLLAEAEALGATESYVHHYNSVENAVIADCEKWGSE